MMNSFLMVAVIVVAVLVDLLWGEPANRFHPVAWMGNFIARAKGLCPQRSNALRFICGSVIVAIGSAMVGATGWLIHLATVSFSDVFRSIAFWPEAIAVLFHACLLKCCFGISSLRRAAESVLLPLEQGNVANAREQLAYHLVSRDVSRLSESEIAAATIESVAENSSDSVVAPLFFYVLGGLPAALVYRYINTCDAMLGYRTPQFEWLGKCAARTDDLLNLVPSRLTAVLMIVASIPSATMSHARKTWNTDARRTVSPNAGHPMSVAAGSLGVRLEKLDHYCLGSEYRPPDTNDIRRMLTLFSSTVVLSVSLACSARLLIGIVSLRASS